MTMKGLHKYINEVSVGMKEKTDLDFSLCVKLQEGGLVLVMFVCKNRKDYEVATPLFNHKGKKVDMFTPEETVHLFGFAMKRKLGDVSFLKQ